MSILEDLLLEDSQPEETQPEDEETVPSEAEDTTPEGEDATPPEGEDEPEQSEEPTGEDEAEESEESPAPVVRAKFNKGVREFSLDEAAPYVEKGLKWDSFQPVYQRLKFMAETTGTDVPSLVRKLTDANEGTEYERILDKAGGNEELARELHEAKKTERERKFDEYLRSESEREEKERAAEIEAENNRIANEFLELQKESGGKFAKVKDVPRPVLKMALDRGISLLDAYLRFEHKESAKAKAAKSKQEEAAKSSTGSLNSGKGRKQTDEYDEVTRAVFGY